MAEPKCNIKTRKAKSEFIGESGKKVSKRI